MKLRLPIMLIASGISLVVLAALADLLGLGKSGIPAAQFLVAELGVATGLAGVWLLLREQSRPMAAADPWSSLAGRIIGAPVIVWVVVGFLLAYLLCFIAPAVFNEQGKFQYFTGYLNEHEHIGYDTRMILDDVRAWFSDERAPKYLFPPLTTIVFTPLVLLRYPGNFYVVAAMTLASTLVLNLLLPLWIRKNEDRLLIYFIFGISIFSYGLQFELDTGQFYTTAMMLLLTAVYIFHRHPAYRLLAYVLFCISVQLKVLPALFVVLFVDDWRDWKTNLKRFAALGLANFLLLFLLGFSYFRLFMQQLLASASQYEPAYNHSIKMFVANLAASGYGLAEGGRLLEWVRGHTALLQGLLYAYVLACILFLLIRSYLRNTKGIDFSLLMGLVLAWLTLPAISHDYNLTLLAAPFVLWLSVQQLQESRWGRSLSLLLIVAASFAYAVTLFPSNARPAYLENSFPSLFIVLTAVIVRAAMQNAPELQGVREHD